VNAQEMMVQSLKAGGYEQIEDRSDMDEDTLGSKEFFIWTTPQQDILCLGSGHSGDEGCKVKFYFVGGTLMGHAALQGEDE
jgi:hypothetical protein